MREKSDSCSITTILKPHADITFSPNMRKLFRILCAVPTGNMEAEESTFCGKRSHNLLRSSSYVEGSIKEINRYSYAQ